MRIERPRCGWLCVACVALSVLTGCPGTLDDKERFLLDADTPDAAAGMGGALSDAAGSAGAGSNACGDVAARIFSPSCGGTGCHGAIAAQQGLDLVSPGLATRVVGVPGKGCAVTLADPQDPAGSLLYQKLSATPPCGAPMPLARPPLSSADAACVLAWIAEQ